MNSIAKVAENGGGNSELYLDGGGRRRSGAGPSDEPEVGGVRGRAKLEGEYLREGR